MGRIRTLTGVCAAAATLLAGLPSAALAAAGHGPSAGHGSSAGHGANVRVVQYRGYRVRVPASWPVYRLAAGSTRCVLFNRPAVYLGTPGADQRCPVRAFGRADALLVQPLGALGDLPPGTTVQEGTAAALPTGAAAAAAGASHQIRLALPAAGVQVTASYGSTASAVRAILSGAQVTRYSAAHQSATQTRTAHQSAAQTGTPQTGTARLGSGPAAHPAARPAVPPATAPVLTGETGSGLGFDACTAPSVATMTSWLASPMRTAGTYLGGDNWACTYGNFTASWVSQVAAEGWRFIPIWVGPQAPCSTIPGAVLINPATAAAQGRTQAASAVTTAAGFGYGTGTPLYFDMEGYTSTASCKQAVLQFLAGWTEELHAKGYLSGVYSSAASGIADLATKYGKPGYTSPDDVYIADWTGDPVLTDPFVPARDWPGQHRLHQFYGGHVETWGGAGVDVDDDVIGAAVAGLASAPSAPAATITVSPDAYTETAGGRIPARLTLTRTAATGQAQIHWQVTPPAGLTVSPSSGSATVKSGSPVTVPVHVTDTSAPSGRYDLPVTATSGGQPLAETFVLVSVVQGAGSLPTATPVVLYAADSASMSEAATIAHRLALPTADLTGTYTTAWNDLTGGKDLLLAVGQAALNGLFTNPCGWSNPAGTGAGHTPFSYLGAPLQASPGANLFENSAATGPSLTNQVTTRLMHYALAGTLPNEGAAITGPHAPTSACLGSPSVPAP